MELLKERIKELESLLEIEILLRKFAESTLEAKTFQIFQDKKILRASVRNSLIVF